jgi:hypothetical protein
VAGAGNAAGRGLRSPPPKSGPVRRPPSKPEFDPSVAEIDEEVAAPAKAAASPAKPKKPKKAAAKGKQLSSRLPKGVWIGVGIGAAVLCLALSGMYYFAAQYQEYMPEAISAGGQVVQSRAGDHTIIVKVNKLIDDYDGNEKEADELYLGNMLRVDGTVARMRKSEDGKVYVDLKEGSRLTMHVVQCQFGFAGERSLASVQTGDQVTVVGKCDGKQGTVILKDCQVVQAPMRTQGGARMRRGS